MGSSKKILVTGSNGQLGRELREIANTRSDLTFLFTTKATTDISSSEDVTKVIEGFHPDVIINAAAYTQVDRAEEEIELAYLLNRDSLINLISAANKSKSAIIHISTDYVYNGSEEIEITENTICNPQSVYGKSKLAGEEMVRSYQGHWMIFRTSWLYSVYRKNFVKTMIRLAESRNTVRIVADQFGTPTWAKDLAHAIIFMIDQYQYDSPPWNQTFNYSNQGKTNWAGFARTIFKLKGIDCRVQDITTKEFGAVAPRPQWSVLSKENISTYLDKPIPHWQDSLEQCLKELEI